MINVLNVVYDERFGGPQSRVLQIAKRLLPMGVRTVVVLPNGDPTFASLLENSGIPYHALPLVRLRKSFNIRHHARFLQMYRDNIKAIRELIKAERIDIVHTNGLMHTQAAVAAVREQVPLLWHLNDTRAPAILRAAIVPWIRRRATRIALSAAAVGDYYFSERPLPAKTHVLYAPVDTNRFGDSGERVRLRKEFGFADDDLVLGTVANFCPGKGFEHAVDALPAIKQQHPKAKLLFVGGILANRKPYWDGLLEQVDRLGVKQDVVFAGRRSDMPDVFAAMDVYVHPSDSEACPMAVLEACATGLPVVATDVGGTRELVEHGSTGLLVSPCDPAAIANAVNSMLTDTHLAKQFGAAAKRKVAASFDVGRAAQAHQELYSLLHREHHGVEPRLADSPIRT